MKIYLVIYFGKMASSYIDIMESQCEINKGRSKGLIYLIGFFGLINSFASLFIEMYPVI